jgi:hypothetical protein
MKNIHIQLDGVGATLFMEHRRHEREFNLVIENDSRALFTDIEHKDWSLLSWRGRLNYLGRRHFFDLDNDQLPRSFDEVETWAKRFMDNCGFQSN